MSTPNGASLRGGAAIVGVGTAGHLHRLPCDLALGGDPFCQAAPFGNFLLAYRKRLLLGLPLVGGHLAQMAIGLTDAGGANNPFRKPSRL